MDKNLSWTNIVFKILVNKHVRRRSANADCSTDIAYVYVISPNTQKILFNFFAFLDETASQK